MKLRQKLAMLMAATMITTTFPTLTSALTTSNLTTQAIVMYHTFNYCHPTTTNKTHIDDQATNINIFNNGSYVIDGITTPQPFHLNGKDIKFSNSIFTTTRGLDNLPRPAESDGKYEEYKVDGKPIDANTPYALVDFSKNNALLGNEGRTGRLTNYNTDNNPKNYADRIFVIDKDGNYTSYVSMRYATHGNVSYVTKTSSNKNNFINPNTTDNIKEVYLFEKIVRDDNDDDPENDDSKTGYQREIYVNKVSSGDNNDLVVNNNSFDIQPYHIGENDLVTANADLISYKVKDGENAEVYLKEFTLFRDPYGSDTILDGEFYQYLQKKSDNSIKLYLPIAFSLTGKAPTVEIMGAEFTYKSLKIFSKIITDLVDYKLKLEGQLSTNGKGDLGIFEITENKLFVFNGTFDAGDDEPTESEMQNGSNGVFLFELDNDDLHFDLGKGDKLWKEDDDGNKIRGELADYIQFVSGLRGFEDEIQIEVLDQDKNKMVVRITDATGSNRKHEGGIEFFRLPIDVNRKTTLPLGDIKVTITQIDPTSIEVKGDKVGDLDFEEANTVEETFVIAEVKDENVRIEALQEATVLTGQDNSKVEIALRELVDDTLDTRDEFYMKIVNGAMSTNVENIWFYADSIPIVNTDKRILDEDDGEYILDIDNLYDAWLDKENYNEETDDMDQIKRNWARVLDEITFNFDLRADLNANTGDVKLIVESDNLKNHHEEIVIGNVKKSFTYEAPPVSVDLGIKEQRTGTITFKETQPEMFHDGSQIVIELDDIGIDKSAYAASVKTDGQSGLRVSSPKYDDGKLILTITEESDEIPGTITIENMQYDIWAGTPRGAYDLRIGGSALDNLNTESDPFNDGKGAIVVKDYLNVGVNLVSSVEVVTAQINFNSGTTVVNGQTQRPMTPPMMLNGWAMIGVRDIASFFGISQDKISAYHDEHDVMTITVVNGTIGETGSTLVTVRNGSKILTVNGTPVIMGQPMTISDDNHAYVPIRPIAEALGLHVYWNDATRVATVSTAFIQ